MAKTMVIGGEYFEVIHTSKFDDMDNRDYCGRRTLWDYYENPSDIKEEIYAEWMQWECETPEVYDLRVTSASCFMFTLGGWYVDPETGEILGYIRITRDHNRVYFPR